MEIQEAIKQIEEQKRSVEINGLYWTDENFDAGIQKIIKDRAEALRMAIDALKKQMPKDLIDDGAFGVCKTCGYEFNSELQSEYEIGYCPECGQKIEWCFDEEAQNEV